MTVKTILSLELMKIRGNGATPQADDLIRNINEEEVLTGLYTNDTDDDLIPNIDENESVSTNGTRRET